MYAVCTSCVMYNNVTIVQNPPLNTLRHAVVKVSTNMLGGCAAAGRVVAPLARRQRLKLQRHIHLGARGGRGLPSANGLQSSRKRQERSRSRQGQGNSRSRQGQGRSKRSAWWGRSSVAVISVAGVAMSSQFDAHEDEETKSEFTGFAHSDSDCKPCAALAATLADRYGDLWRRRAEQEDAAASPMQAANGQDDPGFNGCSLTHGEHAPLSDVTFVASSSDEEVTDASGMDKRNLEELGLTKDAGAAWLFRCESMKNRMKRNKVVYFMYKAMEDAGCPIDLNFVTCRLCTRSVGGSLYVQPNDNVGVVVCGNKMVDDAHFNSTVAHELIHAYDHCRAEVDFQNLLHHACTEIRASNLSGECHFLKEVGRLEFGISEKHKVCVRRRAELSVRMNPHCVDAEHARQAVDLVWDVCYNDHAPFGTQP